MASETLTPCACLGPMYGEPYCLCEMRRRKLPLNEAARTIEEARAKAQFDAFFKSGAFTKGLERNGRH